MNSKENLVFLGMMGSGKSSIGSIVSKKLDIDFIDIDKEVFLKENSPLKLFPFQSRGHYNELGYEKIAELISKKLK